VATATTTDPRLRIGLPDRLAGPGARRLGLAAAAILAELILATALATGRLSIALWVFVLAGMLAIAFAAPMATAVATLVLAASIFYAEWFSFTIGLLDANSAELLLGVLFVVAVANPKHKAWGGIAGASLAIFFVLLGVATFLAYSAGDVDLLGSFAWGRVFLLFAFFWVVIRLFGDRESIATLLGWASALGAVTGLIAVYLSVASGPDSILQDPSQQFIRSEEGLGIIQRVRLPGLSLAYGLFWYAVVRIVQTHGTRRLLWSAATLGMLANIAVSFNRNMWIGLAIGVLLMLILSGSLVRRRLAGALVAIGVAIALLASQLGQETQLNPLIERGTTLTDTESLLTESSLQSRQNETDVAWDVAVTNPLIGIGPGVGFGVSFFEATAQGVWVRVPQLFLHNQYLYVMLIAGIPALIALLVYLFTCLKAAYARRSRTPESAALGVGLIGIMLSAFVAIYFSASDMVFTIALITGALYAAHSNPGEPEEPD
jgi:O-Antigen ligase